MVDIIIITALHTFRCYNSCRITTGHYNKYVITVEIIILMELQLTLLPVFYSC